MSTTGLGMYNKKAHVHFVGIGGIGMSGIAKILALQGYKISGCDTNIAQKSIDELTQLGCSIFEGNNTPHCADPSIDILVYSSAIHATSPEIMAAQKRGIPTIPRAAMLAEIMRTKYSIAISGSHGKTTTTSLVAHILIETKKDPTVIVGGHLQTISTNAHFGAGDFLVAEADESDKSLLRLSPTIAVVTNVDLEHLDTYKNIQDVQETFKQFLLSVPFYGKAIVCADDPHIQEILPLAQVKTLTYGLTPKADLYAQDIHLHPTHSTCTVYACGKTKPLGTLHVPMPGQHNILNTLAALAIAQDLEIPFEQATQALTSFKGIERRFSFNGTYKNAEVFDDYGHHPTEIFHTLEVARKRTKNNLIVVFQPHRYTRTKFLWKEFINAFLATKAEYLILTDIYPASEEPLPGISSQKLVKALQHAAPSRTITHIPLDNNFTAIKNHLDSIVSPNDLVLLLGAGKVNKLAEHLDLKK